MRRFVFLAVVALVTAVVLVSPTQAATPFTVINTNDSGVGSLRQAILDANGAAGEDTINFDPSLSGQTITLSSQQLTIVDSAGLIIDGGSANITVSGNNAVRVFDVRSGAKLTLNNLTVANGRINFGGGIFNNGTLTVNNSTLSGNSAFTEIAAGGGGGIWNAASGTATVSNSTLSGNSAQIAGGGIFNQGGTLTVSNSTLSGNSANNGGSLSSNGGTVSLKNTIVANSPSGGNCSGTVTNGGYNLDSDGSCGFGTANNSLSSTDPMLGALADNGGPTLTHALRAGSPAVDKGNSFGTTADQRGLPRPTDLGPINNARGGDGSDIGAYEQVLCSGDVVNAAGTVIGTPGPDVLRGGEGNDTIFGLGGNDEISGLGGNDDVCSGKGNDTLLGGEGDDTLLGGEGKDILKGGPGRDDLLGLRGDDRLNTVDGVRRNDLADGGTGQDTCKTDRRDDRVSCQ